METTTETKQGYKKTKVGWIPEDWVITQIGKHSKIDAKSLNGKTDPNYKFEYISLGDVNNGMINKNLEEIIFKDSPSRARRVISKGDVLLATVRPNLKSFGFIDTEKKDTIASTGFAVISCKKELDSKFLFYNLFSHSMEGQFYALVVGSNYPAINSSDVKHLKIPLPPLPEQQKIAKILSTWDKAIEQNKNLIEQLKSRKKGLMQQLLTGKTRLKGFSGDWKEVKLGDVFEEITQKNDGGSHEPLTISAKTGFVSQRAKFDRVIAGGSLDKYIQLQKNDFSYNKGNSKTYQMGCIYLLEEYDSAVVPFVYINFRAINSILSNHFYKHWFLNHGLDRQLKAIITSGARGDGLLNVSKKDFFSLKIPLLSTDEQQAIAKVLTTADNEIKAQENYLAQLQAQKKGLMQQLLTGAKRVMSD